MTRAISDKFLDNLKQGILAPLAERVRTDDTLMLALRGRSINIYYRGGSILRLVERPGADKYDASFDKEYVKPGSPLLPDPFPPAVIATEDHCLEWLRALPSLKEIMNYYLATHAAKSEREFQQLVAWENNRSKLANETDYFITDIEYATDVEKDGETEQARLDMLGLKWLTTGRKTSECAPVFIEMKYGTKAYAGTSGIKKHIDDLNKILSEDAQARLAETIATQFNRLDELKLVKFKPNSTHQGVKVVGRPEVIFLLANNNPRSGALARILEEIDEPTNYDLRFFVASYAGYAMHDKCMMGLDQFREWIGGGAKPATA